MFFFSKSYLVWCIFTPREVSLLAVTPDGCTVCQQRKTKEIENQRKRKYISEVKQQLCCTREFSSLLTSCRRESMVRKEKLCELWFISLWQSPKCQFYLVLKEWFWSRDQNDKLKVLFDRKCWKWKWKVLNLDNVSITSCSLEKISS